ncbi:MAG: efflux RND transporter periplasmic adaptor subunit [Syntrophales bacterium]|nr:efflux RND transporter periplasmic adaptor subunit [Syntrophales bacterium]
MCSRVKVLRDTLGGTITFIFLLLFPLLYAGCGRQQAAQVSGAPPEVGVIYVRASTVPIVTELTGRVVPSQISEVRPQVNGIILKRLFQEGSDVKEGQVLYQIDPAPYQAALDNAQAALERAEANLPAIRAKAERVRELLATRAVSQQDYDDVTAALRQAEADVQYWRAVVKTARINLGYTKITAPISGRIGKSNVTEGALVTAHQPVPLTTIQKLDPVYVDVLQSTADMMRLKKMVQSTSRSGNKDNVRLVLEDGTPYQWTGRLQFRDVTVEPSTGSVILRIVFPNPQGILLPGMFVRALVEEGVNKNSLLIPQQAVQRNYRGDPYVFVVDPEGRAQVRLIVLERAIGDKWLVSSGLKAGDQVIVEGIIRVRPGVPVKPVPWSAAPSPSPVSAK